jgi:hypothetical protein
MAPTSAILQKFYVYDPGLHAGDELGRLRVVEDDKGLHVMAPQLSMQYWIDQGMAGRLPLAEVSDATRKFIAQVTRGRSESDEDPKRVPKYDKQIQSGAPGMALKVPLSTQRRNAMLKARKKADKNGKKAAAPKKPEPPKSKPEEKKTETPYFSRPAE